MRVRRVNTDDVRNLMGSPFIRPADLGARRTAVITITGTMLPWGGLKPGTRLVVEFEPPLNRKDKWAVTLANLYPLESWLGDRRSRWIGAQVRIFVDDKVKDHKTGGTQPGIRIKSCWFPAADDEEEEYEYRDDEYYDAEEEVEDEYYDEEYEEEAPPILVQRVKKATKAAPVKKAAKRGKPAPKAAKKTGRRR